MTTESMEDEAAASRPGAGTITLTIDADLASRLAAFRRRHPESAARNEDAIRHILRLWLTENGYDGLRHEDDGRRPEALNASNDD